MLKLAAVSMIAFTSTAAFAAETAAPAPTPTQTLVAPGTLLHYSGWYLAPTAGFTSINGNLAYVPGIRGAIMLNDRFGVGLAVNFLGTDNTRLRDNDVREVGAYGGVYLQYVFHSSSLVHAYVDTTIGQGGWCQQSVNDDCNGRSFALFEPTMNVEVNVTRNVRIATGVGYRLALAEKTEPGQSRRDMAGIIARTSIVIGVF
jgi:hypothetical protein